MDDNSDPHTDERFFYLHGGVSLGAYCTQHDTLASLPRSVKNVLSSVYVLSDGQLSAISTVALVGAVFGQLTFGALADRMGRRVIFVLSITLVIVGSLGSATATDGHAVSLTTQLCCWLAILGTGIGAEYPLSATVSSEASTKETRGKAVSSVFAMQGVGNMLASLVMVVLLHTSLSLDWVWRVALAFGAVPGLATVYWRYKVGGRVVLVAVVECMCAD